LHGYDQRLDVLKIAKSPLSYGAEVNVMFCFETPLTAAIERDSEIAIVLHGHQKVVKILIEKGADAKGSFTTALELGHSIRRVACLTR
jgi:hypothetical protein